jgi:hypothetical protein
MESCCQIPGCKVAKPEPKQPILYPGTWQNTKHSCTVHFTEHSTWRQTLFTTSGPLIWPPDTSIVPGPRWWHVKRLIWELNQWRSDYLQQHIHVLDHKTFDESFGSWAHVPCSNCLAPIINFKSLIFNFLLICLVLILMFQYVCVHTDVANATVNACLLHKHIVTYIKYCINISTSFKTLSTSFELRFVCFCQYFLKRPNLSSLFRKFCLIVSLFQQRLLGGLNGLIRLTLYCFWGVVNVR